MDPPSGGEPGEGADDTDELEAEDEADDGGIDEVFADGMPNDLPAAAPPRPDPRGWSRTDAIVFFLALSVLALSLWAIRWLAHLGSA